MSRHAIILPIALSVCLAHILLYLRASCSHALRATACFSCINGLRRQAKNSSIRVSSLFLDLIIASNLASCIFIRAHS